MSTVATNTAFRAAARQYDSACDCCGHDEPASPKFRIDSHTRRALRKMKGRPEFRATYAQWDATQRRVLPETVAPDPILDLAVARIASRIGPAYAERYGALLQTVVSPVFLPCDPMTREQQAEQAGVRG